MAVTQQISIVLGCCPPQRARNGELPSTAALAEFHSVRIIRLLVGRIRPRFRRLVLGGFERSRAIRGTLSFHPGFQKTI